MGVILDMFGVNTASLQSIFNILFWSLIIFFILFMMGVFTLLLIFFLSYRDVLEFRVPIGGGGYIIHRYRVRKTKHKPIPYLERFGMPFVKKQYYKFPDKYTLITKERGMFKLRDKYEFVQLSPNDYQPIVVRKKSFIDKLLKKEGKEVKIETGKNDSLKRKVKISSSKAIEDTLSEEIDADQVKWLVIPHNLLQWHIQRGKEILKEYEWKNKIAPYLPMIGVFFAGIIVLLVAIFTYQYLEGVVGSAQGLQSQSIEIIKNMQALK